MVMGVKIIISRQLDRCHTRPDLQALDVAERTDVAVDVARILIRDSCLHVRGDVELLSQHL